CSSCSGRTVREYALIAAPIQKEGSTSQSVQRTSVETSLVQSSQSATATAGSPPSRTLRTTACSSPRYWRRGVTASAGRVAEWRAAGPNRSRSAYGKRSHAQQTAEAPRGVVRLRPVVVHEHAAVATIAEERATQPAHVRRRLHPARRLQVEFAQLLQRTVLLLREQLDAHLIGHLHGTAVRLVRLAGPARLTVVADAAAPPGTLRRAVTEEDRSRLAADHVRLAAGLIHRLERAERGRALEKS